jgi:hypothetical protein
MLQEARKSDESDQEGCPRPLPVMVVAGTVARSPFSDPACNGAVRFLIVSIELAHIGR